jgi:hypothetical protein
LTLGWSLADEKKLGTGSRFSDISMLVWPIPKINLKYLSTGGNRRKPLS